MSPTTQQPYDVRFDWGMAGLLALRECRTFVIVDVLSFSTCVSIAVDREASILPLQFGSESAPSFAREHGAVLAGERSERAAFTLSPRSLLEIPRGTKLVLPSPNGSALSVAASGLGRVLAGCFRNRAAVARCAARAAPVAVVAAGERWADGSLRPCLEDLCGAGAIIASISGRRSPEASIALAAFAAAEARLESMLLECASGRELGGRGFQEDVRIAAVLDAAEAAPELRDGAFVRALWETA